MKAGWCNQLDVQVGDYIQFQTNIMGVPRYGTIETIFRNGDILVKTSDIEYNIPAESILWKGTHCENN